MKSLKAKFKKEELLEEIREFLISGEFVEKKETPLTEEEVIGELYSTSMVALETYMKFLRDQKILHGYSSFHTILAADEDCYLFGGFDIDEETAAASCTFECHNNLERDASVGEFNLYLKGLNMHNADFEKVLLYLIKFGMISDKSGTIYDESTPLGCVFGIENNGPDSDNDVTIIPSAMFKQMIKDDIRIEELTGNEYDALPTGVDEADYQLSK